MFVLLTSQLSFFTKQAIHLDVCYDAGSGGGGRFLSRIPF